MLRGEAAELRDDAPCSIAYFSPSSLGSERTGRRILLVGRDLGMHERHVEEAVRRRRVRCRTCGRERAARWQAPVVRAERGRGVGTCSGGTGRTRSRPRAVFASLMFWPQVRPEPFIERRTGCDLLVQFRAALEPSLRVSPEPEVQNVPDPSLCHIQPPSAYST